MMRPHPAKNGLTQSQRSQQNLLPSLRLPRTVPLPADGMARLSTSHEPMGGDGNGTGMEARQGAIEIF